jgi:hypothetical protein
LILLSQHTRFIRSPFLVVRRDSFSPNSFNFFRFHDRISSIMINEYCSLLPVHQKIGRRWWGSAKSCTPFFGVKKKGGVIGGRRCFPPQGLHPNFKFSPQHVVLYYYLPYRTQYDSPPSKYCAGVSYFVVPTSFTYDRE